MHAPTRGLQILALQCCRQAAPVTSEPAPSVFWAPHHLVLSEQLAGKAASQCPAKPGAEVFPYRLQMGCSQSRPKIWDVKPARSHSLVPCGQAPVPQPRPRQGQRLRGPWWRCCWPGTPPAAPQISAPPCSCRWRRPQSTSGCTSSTWDSAAAGWVSRACSCSTGCPPPPPPPKAEPQCSSCAPAGQGQVCGRHQLRHSLREGCQWRAAALLGLRDGDDGRQDGALHRRAEGAALGHRLSAPHRQLVLEALGAGLLQAAVPCTRAGRACQPAGRQGGSVGRCRGLGPHPSAPASLGGGLPGPAAPPLSCPQHSRRSPPAADACSAAGRRSCPCPPHRAARLQVVVGALARKGAVCGQRLALAGPTKNVARAVRLVLELRARNLQVQLLLLRRRRCGGLPSRWCCWPAVQSSSGGEQIQLPTSRAPGPGQGRPSRTSSGIWDSRAKKANGSRVPVPLQSGLWAPAVPASTSSAASACLALILPARTVALAWASSAGPAFKARSVSVAFLLLASIDDGQLRGAGAARHRWRAGVWFQTARLAGLGLAKHQQSACPSAQPGHILRQLCRAAGLDRAGAVWAPHQPGGVQV